MSNVLTELAKRLFDADTKALIKAGYLNNDLTPTKDGEDALIALLIEKHKADYVAAAKEKIEEAREASK